ncbi:di-trans,poly-cis-decaprenylcistransferase [Edhazardia aedis USNM 41457]|uniref:Alkyl transferase n=1 Tax=Edhazardia aedis (strain USNM 41457) TaxID=1003232 RepID=J9D1R0_EDHAE|nr:di-trans,poly-cis-decaprenylcistransferase [Edhazardia aedis USNM 41457]|eukprot:EJW01781.1 di-trans,poly-cis-decaprenylcistransferase [Edhazardia aedis USNM 41457]
MLQKKLKAGLRHTMILGIIRLMEFLINNSIFVNFIVFIAKFTPFNDFFANRYRIDNIAFIMDGNRRFGKKKSFSDLQLKKSGLNKMLEIAQYCHKLGVKDVSFFAFSLSNFSRPKNEVESLMNFIVENKDKLIMNQNTDFKPRIRVFGRLKALDKNVKEILEKLVDETKENRHINFNIFFAYSSKDEIETLKMNKIKQEPNSSEIYQKKVDLLIRTSGEKRLSDFMLMQSCYKTNIFFCRSLWPDFSIAQLCLIIFKVHLENTYLEYN